MLFFSAAPWSKLLQAISAFSMLLLLAVAYFAGKAIPPAGGAHLVGTAVACVPAAVIVGALVFMVAGYEIDAARLRVKRLLWTTTVPLDEVRRIWQDENVIRGSLRVFGNGGVFSFSGVFWSKRLGRYRLFATDLKRCIVIVSKSRTVVVSPADPNAFLEHARSLWPAASGRES